MRDFKEVLDEEEVADLTGYKVPRYQVDWLNRNGWNHYCNAAGRPIIGRVYARMKLAGVNPAKLSNHPSEPAWSLDLSKVH